MTLLWMATYRSHIGRYGDDVYRVDRCVCVTNTNSWVPRILQIIMVSFCTITCISWAEMSRGEVLSPPPDIWIPQQTNNNNKNWGKMHTQTNSSRRSDTPLHIHTHTPFFFFSIGVFIDSKQYKSILIWFDLINLFLFDFLFLLHLYKYITNKTLQYTVGLRVHRVRERGRIEESWKWLSVIFFEGV